MICADDEAGRRRALAKILPMQRADFEAMFEIMAGLPVTIRLLDPPLHEFLPHEDKEAAAVAKALGVAGGEAAGTRRRAARVQPHAGLPRLPARHPLSRDHRDAGARHLRGGRERGQEDRQAGRARGDDPARRLSPGVRRPARRDRQDGGGRRERDRRQARLPNRHHDRAAAGGAQGRRDRLQASLAPSSSRSAPTTSLRPAWGSPATMRRRSSPAIPSTGFSRSIRSCPSIRTASANWCVWAPSAGARRAPASRSASAASTAAIPASIAFCHQVGLDYVSCSPFRVPVARLAAAQAAIGAKGSLDSLSRSTSRNPLSARARSIAPVSARWPAGRARRGDCDRGGGGARASSGRRVAPLASGYRQS